MKKMTQLRKQRKLWRNQTKQNQHKVHQVRNLWYSVKIKYKNIKSNLVETAKSRLCSKEN